MPRIELLRGESLTDTSLGELWPRGSARVVLSSPADGTATPQFVTLCAIDHRVHLNLYKIAFRGQRFLSLSGG